VRVTLVGSDCEENLGIGMSGASLLRAGHRVEVVSYNDGAEVDGVVERVLRQRPKLVGLGIQFQHRLRASCAKRASLDT
jgi:hypothetical protein